MRFFHLVLGYCNKEIGDGEGNILFSNIILSDLYMIF